MEIKMTVEIEGLEAPIEMELKNIENIEDCPEGTIIMIDDYTGRFLGMDDETIMLKSLYGKGVMGLRKYFFDEYWEEVKQI